MKQKKKKRAILKNAYETLSLAFFIFIVFLSSGGLILLFVHYFNDNPNFNPLESKSFLISAAIISSELIAILLYIFFSRKVGKITNELNKGFKEIANGNFNYEIEGNYDKLFENLKNNFNLTVKQLASIETLRKDFATNFSHEFKTPIVSILGFAKLLDNPNISETEKKEYIDIIIEESTRLAKLSSNTMLISKIESQNIISDKKEFFLDEQIRKSVLLLEPLWSIKNIDIDLELDDNILFFGNEELLKEVWINIIDNAIKFSNPNGLIKIKTELIDDNISVYIFDNGIGMDNETIKYIFDKHFQYNKDTNISGNGLGLSIVKKIVTLHNGQINVISTPNKGSTFIVEFMKNNDK